MVQVPPEPEGPQADLQRLWDLFVRFRVTIGIFVLITTVPAILYAIVAEPTYRATIVVSAVQSFKDPGGLSALARVGPGALAKIPGIGRARAARLVACAELARRLRIRAGRPAPRLVTPASVAAYLASRADTLEVEQLWVLSLDGRNGLRGVRCVARGGSHGCAVTAREILRCALGDAASAIVLAHNHPSGDPTPSAEDASMTRAVARAAEVVGVPLLDHVVVTASGSYVSLLERGLL